MSARPRRARPARAPGTACAPSSPASVSPASPPPTTCSSSARRSPRSTRRTSRREGREGRAARDPRRHGPARAGRDRRRCPTTSTCSSPRRAGGPPHRCSRRPRERGIPVWGEVELAWRLRDPEHAAPWLAVTGTNGKTTHRADARRRSCGPPGCAAPPSATSACPIVEAVMDPEPYDVLAVELSSFQLHYTDRCAPSPPWCSTSPRTTSTGTTARTAMADYAADKGRIYERVQRACVYNVADPATERRGRRGRRGRGCPRRSASRSACPASACVGVVEDILADRAFIEERAHQRRRAVHDRRPRLARTRTSSPTRSPRPRWPAPTASRQQAVRDGLRAFRPDGHRIAHVADVGRRHLGRRLQGDQPARRAVLAAGLRVRRLGRRRTGQGGPLRRPRRGRRAGGCAAPCSSVGTAR